MWIEKVGIAIIARHLDIWQETVEIGVQKEELGKEED